MPMPRAARPSALPAETIVAVAHIWNGMIISMPAPARHHHIIHAMAKAGIPHEARGPSAQGFLTSEGRWADRGMAADIAEAAGQPLAERVDERGVRITRSYPLRELFSEDLW